MKIDFKALWRLFVDTLQTFLMLFTSLIVGFAFGRFSVPVDAELSSLLFVSLVLMIPYLFARYIGEVMGDFQHAM